MIAIKSKSGISCVIATVLLLMITIGLTGVAYIYIKNVILSPDYEPEYELKILNLTCKNEYLYEGTSWKVCIIENTEIPCKKILIVETMGYKMGIDCLELRGEIST